MTERPRIGLGKDRHRLVPGRICRLGGVEIPCPVGPDGHSDADAVLHALTDALLGSAGLPDLGTLFPNDDPKWRNQDSARFVTEAVARLAAMKLEVWSIDIAIICDRPRIGPHRDAIRSRIAELLGCDLDRVNLKGKSTEDVADHAEHIDVTAVALVGPA